MSDDSWFEEDYNSEEPWTPDSIVKALMLTTGIITTVVFLIICMGGALTSRETSSPDENVRLVAEALGMPLSEAQRMMREASSPKPAVVIPRLLLGNALAAKDLKALHCAGVTHVLNATSSVPNHEPDAFKYLRIPVEDSNDADLTPHFDQASDFIAEALMEGGSVLVHCQQGVSRSASLVLAYLMRERRWPLARARSHVDQCRWIRPNEMFWEQLRRHECHLQLR